MSRYLRAGEAGAGREAQPGAADGVGGGHAHPLLARACASAPSTATSSSAPPTSSPCPRCPRPTPILSTPDLPTLWSYQFCTVVPTVSHGLALPSPDLPALPQVPIHPPCSAPHLKSLPCGHVSSVLWFLAIFLWLRALWACAPWPSLMLHQLVRGSLPCPCSGKCPSPNPAPHLHPAMSQLFQHSPALTKPWPPSAIASCRPWLGFTADKLAGNTQMQGLLGAKVEAGHEGSANLQSRNTD